MALIPWWIKYPNVNDEALNLDWLLRKMTDLIIEVNNFINLNTIKYANPILWDITSQYEANTVVIDPQTGDAYLSTTPVPAGVLLTNTDYWTPIYNYEQAISNLRKQIAAADEGKSTTATASRYVGQLVWLDGVLNRILTPMNAGDAYVEGTNCSALTIENLLGNLYDLNTIDKTNLVAAINETLTTLSNLRKQIAVADEGKSTTATANRYVGQLVWLDGVLNRILTPMNAGDAYVEGTNCSALTIENLLGNLYDLNTIDKTNLVAAINEILTTLFATTGALSDLETEDKTNLVAAINENRSIITNHRYIMVGDSYGVTPSVSDNCVINFRSYYGLSAADCVNASQGSIGFTLTGYTYLGALQAVEASVSHPETITDIVIFGGYNDLDRGDMTIVTSAASDIVTYAKTHYPNAKVYFIYAGVYRDTAPIITRQNILDLKQSYLTKIAAGGIITTEPIDYCLYPFTMVNSTDHVHPTTAGAQKLASAMYQALFGKFSNDPYTATLTLTNSQGSITINESSLLLYKKDVTYMLLNFVSMFTTAFSFTTGDTTSIKIAEYTSDLLSIYSIYSKWVVLPAEVILNFSGTYYTCSGYLRFASGNVYLDNVNLVSSGGWVTGNLKSVIVRVSAEIPNEII